MIKNYFLSVLFILFISCKEQKFTKSPNVILIITDDQGYGDLGINKNPILKTPNIDELSFESIVFNNFYHCKHLLYYCQQVFYGPKQ